MHDLFDKFNKSLASSELTLPLAKSFISYIVSLEDGTVELRDIREGLSGGVWVFVDVNVSQPNKPAYALKNTEPLAILFHAEDALPGVYSCREDFPDTPHQNWVPEGVPYCLCIDSRPWEEIKVTYTSSELLHRIVLWLSRAGRGELHGMDQPLDPNFLCPSQQIVVPEDVFHSEKERYEFSGELLDEDGAIFRVLRINKKKPPPEKIKNVNMTFLLFEVSPEKMSRLRRAPITLGRLQEEMVTRGVDVYGGIKDNINDRVRDSDDWKRVWLHSLPIILIRTPLINLATNKVESTQTLAFVLSKTVGEVGEALGTLGKNPLLQDKALPYTLLVQPKEPNISALDVIPLGVANVIPAFEASLAARLAGREEPDMRQTVLVGAGSVGSLVADALVREGRFELTIVDSDTLLPHNLARHSLPAFFVGKKKAKALAEYLSNIRQGFEPTSIVADILKEDFEDEELRFALHDAQIILDASASVPVARHLNDMTVDGRRASFFYCSGGDAAVLMVEDCKRKIDLRHLESSLYSEILKNDLVNNIFAGNESLLQYSGSCGDLTLRMAASKAQILSGLIARELGNALENNEAVLRIWRLEGDGSISVHASDVVEPVVYNLNDWCIRVSRPLAGVLHSIRCSKLPKETGGALLGVVDIPKKQLDILGALPAPSDSKEGLTEFQRGVVGLREQFEDVVLRTLGQVRYVGEWHSHPIGHGTFPSKVDLGDLATITETLSVDGCPGVQLILGCQEMSLVLGLAKGEK